MDHTPTGLEHALVGATEWLKLGVEAVGVGLASIGVGIATGQLVRRLAVGKTPDFSAVRLTLARYLSLALEFQLGADILGTAVSPGWEQIGKLGAVAAIRTGLNIVLSMELKQAGIAHETQERIS